MLDEAVNKLIIWEKSKYFAGFLVVVNIFAFATYRILDSLSLKLAQFLVKQFFSLYNGNNIFIQAVSITQ